MAAARHAIALHALLVLLLLALLAPTISAFGLSDEPKHCENCMDGMPMEGCPHPALCGFKPFLCVDCMDGMAMPKCPHPEWCKDVLCGPKCMDGMPMEGCPDPGACGFEPTKCYGCVPGQANVGCPKPHWCYNNMTTPPCMNCMEGMAMPYCPNATACLLPGPTPPSPTPDPGPGLQCIDCMAGMAMPQCPFPELCDLSNTCAMNMYFGVDSGFCVFFKQWRVNDAAQWAAAFFGVLLLCFMREALTVFRVHQNMTHRQNERLRRMYTRDPATAQKVGVWVSTTTTSVSSYEPASSVALGPSAAASSSSTVQRSEALLSNVGGQGPSDGGAMMLSLRPLPSPQPEVLLLALESVYYLFSLILAYLLMLLIMTYNVYLCLIVVIGCAVAHFVCNLFYSSLVRRPALASLRARTLEFQRAQRQAGVPQQGDRAEGIIAYAAPTGGDHCCDDIDYGEDI